LITLPLRPWVRHVLIMRCILRFQGGLLIVINRKLLSPVCELMQKALFIVQTWCQEVGLSVYADKTLMVFCTNNIKLVSQVKYLGVILYMKTGTAILITGCRSPPLPSGNVDGR
jgi:hypothetical protein